MPACPRLIWPHEGTCVSSPLDLLVWMAGPLDRPTSFNNVWPEDNPESVRVRKYLTGTHLLVNSVGVKVGTGPREVVWAAGKARLYRYASKHADPFPIPVLLVYALVLRPYILDLVPGRSLVEHLVDNGFEVYLLDWGAPNENDGNTGLEEYVLDRLPVVVNNVLARSSGSRVSVLGHCQGGTMAAIYAALHPGEALRNLIMLAAPVDFAPPDPGPLGTWTLLTRRGYPAPEWLLGPSGNVPADVPGRLLQAATEALVSMWGWTEALAELRDRIAEDEEQRAWLGAARWVDDAVPLVGRMFSQWMHELYQENRLIEGALRLRGRPVDLSRVEASVLNIAGTFDTIAPLAQTASTLEHLGSNDVASLVVARGHVGLVVGPSTRSEVWEPMTEWLAERSTT